MLNQINNQIINRLSQSELSVLRYLDAHQQEVPDMTIQECARQALTSTATILRLCKKMDLKGFSELKFLLRQQNKKAEQPVVSASLPALIKDRYENVEDTCRLIDTKSLERVVDLLLGPQLFHMYAEGASSIVTNYLERYLLSAGRSAIAYPNPRMAAQIAGKLTSEDVIFLISISGHSSSIRKIAQLARSSGATIISISNYDNQVFSDLSDIPFHTFIEDRFCYSADVRTRMPVFFIADTIMQCYLNRLEQLSDET